MSPEREVLNTAAELLETGEPFVMVTVIRTQGSTPRAAGARMIWRPHAPGRVAGLDRDAAWPNGANGTVGGGQFEHLVLDAARACYDKRQPMVEKFVLGADADQCCGGTMEVFLEYHGRPARVVIFGAGHVAHSLAGLLAGTAVEVVVVDDREDWASPARFPAARCVNSWDQGVTLAREHTSRTLAVVMTCSHDTDLDLLRALLTTADRTGGPPLPAALAPPAFVGLIGSRPKRVCLFGRLVASGIDESLVQRVHCPIGVGDTGKEPHAIAISIAAQLLMEARSLARA